MTGTKKQHFIPRFKLRGWLNEENYFNIHQYNQDKTEDLKVFYNEGKKSFSPDLFYEEYFYEEEHFGFNEIEKNLSWLETKFGLILKKAKENIKNKTLTLNRKELEIIKCFLFTSGLRGKTFDKRLKDLDGDLIFKAINGKLTKKQRNVNKLKDINNLILMVKEMHECKVWEDSSNIKMSYKSHLNPISFSLWGEFSNTTIKIFRTKSEFLLTDNSSSMIMNPITKITQLISLYPISKDICFGLLNSNELLRSATRAGIPDITHTSDGWSMAKEILSINSGKFKNINHTCKYKKNQTPYKPKLSWEDRFTYPWSTLDFHETGVVNSFLINQSLTFVVYPKNREVMEYAFELEKKYKIYRIEEES